MLKRLHDKGLKVCVWINPYISQKSPLFKIGKEKGYFIKHTDGSVWQWDLWQPGNAVVDFTNPEARAWYQGLLKNLLDMGVDCFKMDFGERIPMHDAVFFNGGNQQKVVLAKLLNVDLDVLILDEPTKGVDVGAKSQMYEIMSELAQKGYAIVLISSEMPEVLAMSDRIGVMHEGKLVKILNRDEATQEKLLAYAMNSADTMLKEETGRE